MTCHNSRHPQNVSAAPSLLRLATMKNKVVFVALLTAALGRPLLAQKDPLIDADRPGIANSATVVGRGTFQMEGGLERAHSPASDGKLVTLTVPVLLRYGVSDRFELRAESDTFSRQRSSDHSNDGHGLSPVALGFKWQMLDGGERATLKDFGLIGSLTPPSGRGVFRQDHATGSLLAAADVGLSAKWTANPNAGAGVYHGSDGQSRVAPFIAVTFEYDVTERLHPAFEIARILPDEGEDRRPTIVNAQLAWIVAPSTQFDLEAGRDLRDASRRYVTAGVSVRFR
jgi:hypothetical protein